MVAHENSGPGQQCLLPASGLPTVHDPECNACGEPHGPLESPSDRPLTQASIPNQSQKYAGEDAVHGADDHHDHTRDEESCERGKLRKLLRQHGRQRAQKDDEKRRPGHCVEEPAHGQWMGWYKQLYALATRMQA